MMDHEMKGWKQIEQKVREDAVEEKEGIDIIRADWTRIVCDKKKGIVYGWYDGAFDREGKRFIKYSQIFEEYGNVIPRIKEACKEAGFVPKEIICADWIAKKEFYKS